MEEKYIILEDVVRNHYANVFWTHKIQEKQTEVYEKRYKCFTLVSIITSAITSAGVISIVFINPTWLKIATVIISFITTAVSAILATFDYNRMAKSNKSTATELVILRDRLLSLLARIRMKEKSVQELENNFDELQKCVHRVYMDAPNTTNKAVKIASAEVGKWRDGVYTNEEIDCLLPESLRRDVSD